MHPIVVRIEGLAHAVAEARSRRAFLAALAGFERALASVADFTRGALPAPDGQALAALTDSVVASIEDRLDRRTDRPAVRQTLAAAVYRLRQDVENLDMLIRHYAPSAPLTPR